LVGLTDAFKSREDSLQCPNPFYVGLTHSRPLELQLCSVLPVSLTSALSLQQLYFHRHRLPGGELEDLLRAFAADFDGDVVVALAAERQQELGPRLFGRLI